MERDQWDRWSFSGEHWETSHRFQLYRWVISPDSSAVHLTVSNGMSELTIAGTGVSFDFAQRIPEDWLHKLTVNSSAPPTSADITSTSLTNLVPGAHRFTLELFPPAPDPFSPAPPSNASVTFTGATGYLGAILNAATKNVTIDDTAWRTGEVVLSPAWNMMEGGQGGSSNWINTTQIDAERGTAGENWNSSLSWTEERGANTTIAFAGEAVWVYGVAGGEAGRYEVLVDGTEMGRYNASGGAKA